MIEADDALLLRFAKALLDPGQAPTALFRGPPERNVRRFALYRGNLTANWERTLANAYPVLRQVVGEEFFRALARDYGRQVPSVSGDLNQLGEGLAAFLENFGATRAYPYFPDLARLEWAVHCTHHAADARALAPADLNASTLAGGRFHLRAGQTLLASPWAIVDLWQAHQDPPGAAIPAEIAQPCRALVFRSEWRVRVRGLGLGEWTALHALQDGAPLPAALEDGMDADPGFDPGGALQAWLEQRLLGPVAEETA